MLPRHTIYYLSPTCRYRRVREGNYPVQTSGHTLILNWNSQLVPLLRQMRVAREERGAFQGERV